MSGTIDFGCECATWAYCDEEPSNGHHPSCPHGHSAGCVCLRCQCQARIPGPPGEEE